MMSNVLIAGQLEGETCRLRLISFGLSDKYIEGVYENFFYLVFKGNWSFFEAYNLPIMIREWFFRRLAKHYEQQREAQENAIQK